jgi:hypothetical protein
MKRRTTVIIAVGLVAVLLFAIFPPQRAGATTTTTTVPKPSPTPAQVKASMTSAQLTYFKDGTQAAQNNPALSPTVSPPTTGNTVPGAASVSFGWAVYIHYTHVDVESTVFVAGLAGLGYALFWICGVVAYINVIAGALCAADVSIDAATTGFLMAVAGAAGPNIHVADWCGSFIPPHGFNWTACNNPGGRGMIGNPYLAWSPYYGGYYVWVYSAKDSGLTTALQYAGGTLIGWTIDEPSCPC